MRFVICFVIACGPTAAPKPVVTPPPEVPVVVAPPPPPDARSAVERIAVAPSPMSITIRAGQLYWTDGMGAIWTMPAAGGAPRQLTSPNFAFKVVAAGDAVIASTRKDLMSVGETVTLMNIRGLVEYPEEIVADEAFVYVTMFKKNQIMRIPVTGGDAQQIGELPRGVLAVGKDTLYAVSYATGVLVAIPKAGGRARTIAKGLVRPTALAVDDTHAFAYSEKDKTLTAIDLTSGETHVIATGLTNSDELVGDGEWLYTRSWDQGSTGSVLRIAKDGSSQTALVSDLAAPYNIAFDAASVFVTARDGAQIVVLAKP